MKLGISTWSLLQSDLYSAVHAIGDAGYDYIELWGEVPHAYHDWANKNQLKDALSAYEFTITMHAPFTDLNPATPFEPVRGAVVKTLRDFMKFASELDALRVTFHPGSVHSGAMASKSLEDVVILLQNLCKEGSGNPIINVENQPRSRSHYHFPVGSSPESIEALLTTVNGISYTLDTGHAHVNGDDPLKLYERFEEHVTEIHLHDNDGTGDDHLAPGRGTARLKELVEKVRGKETLVCLELNPYKYTPDQVFEAAAELKNP